ncbi:MAG: cold-shock protein [Bacteroidetes bacterium SW_9_63_38]|nr:MAG: cold-shock protein [Bacteroidetes bacterium SW_9_63_38]
MQESTVKWFDAKKGYGFIHHPEDGDDVFVHYSNIDSDDDFKTLHADQTVRFEMNDGPKGLNASNVQPVGSNASAGPDDSDSAPTNQADDPAPEIDPGNVDPTAQVDPTAAR